MFLTSARAEDRSAVGDWWYEPVGRSGIGGGRVTSDRAMMLSAVYRAVFLLSGHFAMLPLLLKQEGSMKRVKGHALQKLFKRPNPFQNGFEWRMMLMGHLLLRGNAYNEMVFDRAGNITALMPRHPDRVKIEMLTGGDYRYVYTDADGTTRRIHRGSMWHLRGLSSNGIVGLSVIDCAAESLGGALAAQSYANKFFSNDAKPSGGWIKVPGKFADKAARDAFRESVQVAQGDNNRGKIMVLDRDMEYHEVGITNEEAQFLESRKFSISDIARWFGLPPHKLGDLERATFTNIEQQSLEYITDALLIWTELWEASAESDLLLDDEGLEVEFDFHKLTRGDSAARRAYYKDGILTGWLTRNEAREEEGKEPLDGLDEPLRPLNMAEEGNKEESESTGDGKDPVDPDAKKDEADPAGKGDNAARLQALLTSNASRLARRIVKAGTVDPALVAEALAIDEGRAVEWSRNTLWTASTLTEQNLTAALLQLGAAQ